MRVLVFGANGQVARELQARAGEHDLAAYGRETCDLSEEGAAARCIERFEPDAVINASAYTAVDKAESEEELARRLNAFAPEEIARACASRSIPFVHFSTDYVFDGSAKSPYREDSKTAPLGAYGRTKLEGEQRVQDAGGVYAIVRLSWVFSAYGANFVKTMLRLGKERDALRVVADQHGKPTPAGAAAEAALTTARLLKAEPAKTGVYHFAGDEATTWAGFAEAIMREAGLATRVEPIGTKDYPTPAKRPAWSVLDTSKITRVFGLPAPSWRKELKQVVRALHTGES